MSIVIDGVRESDSPLVETVMYGYTEAAGSLVRPAESYWHMVLSKRPDTTELLLVGPWSTAGTIKFGPDAEILWIRFNMGVYMPHLLTRKLLNSEMPLPEASGNNFWIKGAAMQFPDYENADTFIERLMHNEILAMDSVVRAVLDNEHVNVSSRTVRHRFLYTVGLPFKRVQQIERANRASGMLQSGVSILDTAFDLGYYDQSHLTNSLRQLIGKTPSQLLDTRRSG